jgi:hypothetical protein
MLVSLEHHRPHSLWGWAIALATRSIWSHTAVIIGKDRYEALVGQGFVKRPWKYRKGTYETVLNLSESQGKAFQARLELMVGTKYPAPWYMALSYVFAPFLRDMKRRLYCSQAALEAIKSAGLYSGIIEIGGNLIDLDKRFKSKPSPGVLYFIAETLAARPDLRTLGK